MYDYMQRDRVRVITLWQRHIHLRELMLKKKNSGSLSLFQLNYPRLPTFFILLQINFELGSC
jgi:hypothetical protein